MATLYQKYRPQNFREIIGQNHVKITLEHEIETGKIAHAYLFCGPRAVGKTTIARLLAKAINCINRKDSKSEPCNECDICTEITSQRSLDIIEIDAASHTGVDNVRENIIANARVTPARCKYKVFVIDEVHMLSTSAFNALLKVIEEPPAFVVFILCTTEVHKVPMTVISRCQRFDFKRISINEITKRLELIAGKEKIKVDKKILEAIARQSEGHMRDAESLLGQVVAIGGKEITPEEADLVIPRSDISEVVDLIGFLKNKDAGSAIALINRMVDEGVDLKRFTTDLIEILRSIMLAKISPALSAKIGLTLGENLEAKISSVSRNLDVNRVLLFSEKFIEARSNLKGSFIIQLPLEIAIAELCLLSSVTSSQPAPAAPMNIPVSEHSKNKTNLDLNELDIKAISAKWNEVLARVKKYNHSLSFILRVCKPREINGSQICLAFKYKFHKDRIKETEINKIIEKVLHEVYGVNLTIEAIIDESLEVENGDQIKNNIRTDSKTENEPENMVDNLLKTFGGKVIK